MQIIIFLKKKIYKNKAKKILKLGKNTSVIGYAGSINKIYLIQKMIDFYKIYRKRIKN